MTEGKPVDVPLQTAGRPGQSGRGRAARRASIRVPGGEPPAAGRAERQRPARAGRLADAARTIRSTARVMVNRIWQHHFGRGIVATPSNFGVRGEPPTHPELLDWLAARFVAGGWSIKAMHREILLSETYQLSSEHRRRKRGARPRGPLALAVSAPPARRRVDPRRDAGRLGQARTTPAGAASVPADRGLALDPAQPVQGGLSRPTTAAST